MNLAQRLGYDAGEKLLIIHADDVGSTHAANLATFELLEAGTITSGSLITPAPWFSEAAAYACDHPDADLGIHLALNSEYPLYRWSGVLGKTACPTIHDSGGYLPRTVEELKEGDPEEVEAELRPDRSGRGGRRRRNSSGYAYGRRPPRQVLCRLHQVGC